MSLADSTAQRIEHITEVLCKPLLRLPLFPCRGHGHFNSPPLPAFAAAATVGTEYDLGARDCVKCAPGSYRPLAGSIKALGTPNVLHTAGDDGLQACLDWCAPQRGVGGDGGGGAYVCSVGMSLAPAWVSARGMHGAACARPLAAHPSPRPTQLPAPNVQPSWHLLGRRCSGPSAVPALPQGPGAQAQDMAWSQAAEGQAHAALLGGSRRMRCPQQREKRLAPQHRRSTHQRASPPHPRPPQFNPSPGLGDQTSRSGLKCFGCPAGSIALREDMSAETATDATMPTGATFCDAW